MKLRFMHHPTPESFHEHSFHKPSGTTIPKRFMQDGHREPFHELYFNASPPVNVSVQDTTPFRGPKWARVVDASLTRR